MFSEFPFYLHFCVDAGLTHIFSTSSQEQGVALRVHLHRCHDDSPSFQWQLHDHDICHDYFVRIGSRRQPGASSIDRASADDLWLSGVYGVRGEIWQKGVYSSFSLLVHDTD